MQQLRAVIRFVDEMTWERKTEMILAKKGHDILNISEHIDRVEGWRKTHWVWFGCLCAAESMIVIRLLLWLNE